jgi:hypothetical protein
MAEKQENLVAGQKLTAFQMQEKRREIGMKRAKRLVANLIVISIIMTLLGAGLTSIGMRQVFVFILIALLPGIVAGLTDTRAGKFASKTVIAFNVAGMVQFLGAILMGGSPNLTATEVIYDARTWMQIYGFAAFGWGVVFAIPHITQLYLEITATYTVKKLKKFQDALVDEWGEAVKK